MTLPEVLIAIAITGLVASTLAMVTTVILRQSDNTEGRSNNARSEQNINQWMPTDLSSAEAVDKLPGSKPCGVTLPACPAGAELRGSNALMLTWHGRQYIGPPANRVVDTLTVVSYRVIQEASGEFRLYRVQCTSVDGAAMTCTSLVVLRQLDAPPAEITWIPGTTAPTWVMTVTDALLADDVSGAGDVVAAPDPSYKNKGAQRLVVTIDGGGDAAGAGGGVNQISLSAGGTNREIGLTVDSLDGTPNFAAARSRCGGNFGMVVDHSGSISDTQLASVKTGINNFIDTFAGTPIKLQVVTFGDIADTLGATAPTWGKYYDMLVDADVTALKGLVNGVARGGWTNWEDGLMRMLRNSDGTIQSQLPGTVIFFTDGVPTKSRVEGSAASAPVVIDPADSGLTHLTDGNFDQISWNRAQRIVRDRGAINLVGVFVNTNANAMSTWTLTPSGYDYEVGNTVVYQQSSATYERNANVIYQVGSSNIKFEKLVAGSWVSAATPSSNTSSAARNAYLSANTTTDSSDGWKATRSGSPSGWTTITAAQYNASNTAAGNNDGFQTAVSPSLSSTWATVTAGVYGLSNTTTDSSDGWRTTTTWNTITQAAYFVGNVNNTTTDGFRTTTSGSSTTWAPVSVVQYNASNTTSDSTDGWRANFRPAQTLQIKDYATIGNLIVGNTSGIEGGFVEALPRGGPYPDAAAADLFVLPNYTNFSNALASIALDQCGGTVTLQTKVGATGALDPFTYQNTTSLQTVQTSAAFRSGTFDVALPGGASESVTITPQDFTNLTAYVPAGWSCKSAGVAYPFTSAAVPGHAPWTSITLTVSPNKAVSCVQQVTPA